MKVEQIYTGCLAQGAYYIISEGEAAIIETASADRGGVIDRHPEQTIRTIVEGCPVVVAERRQRQLKITPVITAPNGMHGCVPEKH